MENIGRLLLFGGIILAIVGGILTIGGRFGLGKLPGDIFFQRGNVTFYFPLVSGIIISLVLTIILNLVFRK